MNYDIKPAGKRRLLQLNELDEIRLNAYESSRIYKERTKALHDKKIILRKFAEGDKVLVTSARIGAFQYSYSTQTSRYFLENFVQNGQALSS